MLPIDFLGRGWSFPIAWDKKRKQISVTANEEKIKQSIYIILGTAKGERIMRPDFGCGIHEFTFSVFNSATVTMIKSAIKDALIQWEPRIEVMRVDVSAEELSDGILNVRVDYRVISTNNEFNLVYPFYLRGGA
ncbi:MAG: baseplate protein [Nitrospirales bacterium]|nr:MAG: baseplate protein [Nitrospirales bacterium]